MYISNIHNVGRFMKFKSYSDSDIPVVICQLLSSRWFWGNMGRQYPGSPWEKVYQIYGVESRLFEQGMDSYLLPIWDRMQRFCLQQPSRSSCVTWALVEGRWLSWARRRRKLRRHVQHGYDRSMYRRADKDSVAVFKLYVNQQEVAPFCAAGPPPGGSTEINGPKLPEMGDTQPRILLVLHKASYIFFSLLCFEWLSTPVCELTESTIQMLKTNSCRNMAYCFLHSLLQ